MAGTENLVETSNILKGIDTAEVAGITTPAGTEIEKRTGAAETATSMETGNINKRTGDLIVLNWAAGPKWHSLLLIPFSCRALN